MPCALSPARSANSSWVRLDATAKKGDSTVVLSESVSGWKAGDRVIVTMTGVAPASGYSHPGSDPKGTTTEERTIKAIADHGARFVGYNVMHLEAGTRDHFLKFIEREFPAMLPKFERLYTQKRAPIAYRKEVQAMVRVLGGRVEGAEAGEFGRTQLELSNGGGRLLGGLPVEQQCWMSHRDCVFEAPPEGYLNAVVRP